jgi:mannose-6-phosphate isomerase-like protein (cupin superfamily)
MHSVLRASDYTLSVPDLYASHSRGYTAASLVADDSGSVHTGLSLNAIAAGGHVAVHLHSYEESFYVLEGEADVRLGDQTWHVGRGDYGVAKVGTLHAWRSRGTAPVRWLSMAAPQPKPDGRERDTFFAASGEEVRAGRFPSEAAGALLGRFDVTQIPPGTEGRAVSGGLQGVFLKWLIDAAFGAVHHRLAIIEYLPGVSIALHDHTFEESYFVLSGHIEAMLDGQKYLAGPGDVLWTGVGCVHSFANAGGEPVRWLETFSPQPPAENVFRFMAEWDEKGRALEATRQARTPTGH